MVALVVIITVMSILVAAALPYWSQMIKRDREAELIFRGLQYAEAIRVFQLRFKRLPTSLDELIKTNPRSIRRLWPDPMTDGGEWKPIFARANQGGGTQGRPVAGGTAPGGDAERNAGSQRRTGPIIGVQSRSKDAGVRSFLGSSSYADWQFTIELIPVPVTIPDTLLVPRPTSEWIGKPFREDLGPQPGKAPGGQNLNQPQGNDG
jgi:type II secretory pathway pseudopilin PulG